MGDGDDNNVDVVDDCDDVGWQRPCALSPTRPVMVMRALLWRCLRVVANAAFVVDAAS